MSQCQAQTQKGRQCSRQAKIAQLCLQHYNITGMPTLPPPAPVPPPANNSPLENAIKLWHIYEHEYQFPQWVLEYWDSHLFKDTKVFYHCDDNLTKVKQIALQREPVNIAMNRHYNIDEMKSTFGWKYGAYDSTMPNIAVYCYATVKGIKKPVHVLNLIGCALDSDRQPDYNKYTTLPMLVEFYSRMWKLALSAIKNLGKTKFQIYNVGGGAFAGDYFDDFIELVFEPAFLPLMDEFTKNGITILGYDFKNHKFNGGFIPKCLADADLANTVFVNAWDPWSIIGNGNASDNSLDGYWGRSSNMSVLGWPKTNPYIKYICV